MHVYSPRNHKRHTKIHNNMSCPMSPMKSRDITLPDAVLAVVVEDPVLLSLTKCYIATCCMHLLYIHVVLATVILAGLIAYILSLRLHNQLLPELQYGISCNSEWIEREQHVYIGNK